MLLIYLLFSMFCVFTYCLASKKVDEQDVTIGLMAGYVILSLIPILNIVSVLYCLFYTAHHTGFWNKKLF
jgi:uncharacterized membrane protein YagU involved in acid resistance